MSEAFGVTSTTDEVLQGIDLSGRRILVTGVSAGLGVETARALAARGADIVGAARDLGKADAALGGARAAAEAGGGSIALVELDLASLESVRACADKLLADGRSFDVIIANAGIMATPQGRTADGFEQQFGTNHLGHFVLINRLLPLLRAGSRVVSLSSAGHGISDVDLDDPGFERSPYDPWLAYGRAKTANILFAVAFDRRHRAEGIRATAVHPGAINTELGRYLTPETMEALSAAIKQAEQAAGEGTFAYKTVPQGAATSVWAAVVADGDEVGGRYCQDCHVAEVVQGEGLGDGVRPYAIDPERAEALWTLSEKMVGERF